MLFSFYVLLLILRWFCFPIMAFVLQPARSDQVTLRSGASSTPTSTSNPDDISVVVIGKLMIDHMQPKNGGLESLRLGGGALQACFGGILWNRKVGLVAPVGEEFPDLSGVGYTSVHHLGIDTRGITPLQGFQTPHLTIEYEGQQLVWRPTEGWDKWAELLEEDTPIPEEYRKASIIHVVTEAGGAASRMALALKIAKPSSVLSIEPVLFDLPAAAMAVTKMKPLTSVADVVSPDWPAACAIADMSASTAPELVCMEVARRLSLHNSAVLSIRRGGDGSFLWFGKHPSICTHVPAYLVNCVIDPTGAGNAYCGALASLLPTLPWDVNTLEDIIHAAARASATGACVVEVDGLPHIASEELSEKLELYVQNILSRVEKIQIV